MFNRSEILRSAWADYRRDADKGWGVVRGTAFNRAHFAYCLRFSWMVAKERAAKAAAAGDERTALIREAGNLNNHSALICADHVSIMGMMDLPECRAHVAHLRQRIAPKPSAAVSARVEVIRAELVGQDYGDRIDWNRRRELRAELSSLGA